jgi:hypothetical protein
MNNAKNIPNIELGLLSVLENTPLLRINNL